MSLFNKLFGKLFGNNGDGNQKPAQENYAAPQKIDVNDYMARWEKERKERMLATEQQHKDWIIAKVKEKGGLTFSWESGNDEAFVTFESNTDKAEENKFWDLEQYVIDALDIPDAGEFSMTGNGLIYIVDDVVKVTYSSTIRGLLDYNEETEEEVYSEEEQDSGDKVLFDV